TTQRRARPASTRRTPATRPATATTTATGGPGRRTEPRAVRSPARSGTDGYASAALCWRPWRRRPALWLGSGPSRSCGRLVLGFGVGGVGLGRVGHARGFVGQLGLVRLASVRVQARIDGVNVIE